jgi:hypothetical protein
MNKLLKDAIADAKAVRETALANAKLALEEAFAPRMQKMFSEKIKHEMEEDAPVEDESTMQASMDNMENEMMNKPQEGDMAERMKELAGLNEFEDDEFMGGDDLDDDDDFDDDLGDVEDLDLDPDEEGFDTGDSDEDTGYGDDKFEEGIDEDLEEIIRQLEEEGEDDEDEGINTGRTAPGEPYNTQFTEAKEKEDEELDEEIDLDEVIAALKEGEDDFEDGDRVVNENAFMEMGAAAFDAIKNAYESGLIKGDPNDASTWVNIFDAAAGALGIGGATAIGMNANTIRSKVKDALSKMKPGKNTNSPEQTPAAMQELEEAYSVIEHLREKINEVNLLNAKLLYVNKLFKKHNLTEDQKIRVVETFDRATTVRETKLIFTTLSESFATKATKKTKVMEGFASNPVKKTQILTESNSIVTRFQKLAGLTNNEE